ncbi:MAG: Transposase IS200 like [Phormidesmis priestleyi Ana]|uniref:Transposase IS200 like n=1 Tax=Phormidesmis priestleyi Ana TaxID=1666911 RepID=A0A0P8A3I9_9CYAN|nr:MAG: Transposase IS200 like [Phormidesmis priestleyi Ana]
MIKNSRLNNIPSVEAALYYVQLKTHNSRSLFVPSADHLSTNKTSTSSSNPLQNEQNDDLADSLNSGLNNDQREQQTQATALLLAQVVADEILVAARHWEIALDQWVILPDELQALVYLPSHPDDLLARSLTPVTTHRLDPRTVGKRKQGPGKPRALTSFIAGFKAASAKRINLLRNQPGSPVWQRSYSEQLIDGEALRNRLKNNLCGLNGAVMRSPDL